MRGFCSGDLGLFFRFFDMGGTEVLPPVGLLYGTPAPPRQTCLLQIPDLAMTAQKDKERLLSILHAHGQQFLTAFDIPAAPKHETKDSDDSESEEEWTGIRSLADMGTSETVSDGERDDGV